MEDYNTPVISFEGPEKRILAYYQCKNESQKYGSLRNIDSTIWEILLSHVGCEVLSIMKNNYCTSFVLSESSLFVFDKHLMIKTCGRTRLLKFLEPLQEQILNHNLNLELERVIYSRKTFYFPEAQFSPHRSWDEEQNILNKLLPGGVGRVMGSHEDEDQWNTYVWEAPNANCSEHESENNVFEVMMMNLSRSKMEQFYQKMGSCCDVVNSQFADGKVKYSVTNESGIVNLIPGSMIDDFQFEPCGYSMNGLNDKYYWTIHITPEAQCSYVSFETTVPLASRQEYLELLQKLVKTFEPGRFSVTLYGKEVDLDDITSLPLHTFVSLSSEKQVISENRSLVMCNYISEFDLYERKERARVMKYVQERILGNVEITPFYLVNTYHIESQMNRWKEMLPRVKPFYTVSCNSSPQILKLIHEIGAGFDCFNAKDISYLSFLNGADITLGNPYFKQIRDLMVASSSGVQRIIVDSDIKELEKIAKYTKNAQLLLRINTSGHYNHECMQGIAPEQCEIVLEKAKSLDLNVIGISLVHSFNKCVSPQKRLGIWKEESLVKVKNVVFKSFDKFGYNPNILDIGGSIWSSGVGLDDDGAGYDAHFDTLTIGISSALDQVFPENEFSNLKIFASDCASFLVSKSHTLVTQVFANKLPDSEDSNTEYFINDGYSGSVSQSKLLSMSDRHRYKTLVDGCEEDVNDVYSLFSRHMEIRYMKNITATTKFMKSNIYGPSCDISLDCLCKDVILPELDVGEICYFLNMGAIQHHYDRSQSEFDYVFIHEE